jgi:hypothetical protein
MFGSVRILGMVTGIYSSSYHRVLEKNNGTQFHMNLSKNKMLSLILF